jgi:hypothetical protein
MSENYFEDDLCEKEAKYADQIRKNIIPVRIRNYEPIEWLRNIIKNESYFQLFGSDNHFNLEYDKLLLKVVSFNNIGLDEKDLSRTSQFSILRCL